MNGLFINLKNLIVGTILNVIAVNENQKDYESDNDSGSDASSIVSQYFKEGFNQKLESSNQENENPNIVAKNGESGGNIQSILKNSNLNKTFNS